MIPLRIAALAAALVLGGCFKVPEKIDVNIRNGGDSSASVPAGSGSGGGSWSDIAAGMAGKVFLDDEYGVLFYAFDTLAYPGAPIDLSASVQASRQMKGIPGATVEFRLGEQVLGVAASNERGMASIKWTPPGDGLFEVTARIIAAPAGWPATMLQVSAAPLLVAAYQRPVQLAVIDLDHTIVDAGFFRALVGGAKPMAGSVEVTGRIAEQYGVVYLTHRPDLLTRKSKAWLLQHGYPRGPLMVSEIDQAFGDSGQFKAATLAGLRKAYPNLAIGIGDKLSDAQAYVDNGLTAYLIPHYKAKPKDMREMAADIRKLDGRGRLQVVDGWGDIEVGIFGGRKFPPQDYARRLDAQADRLQREIKQREAEEKRREREEERREKEEEKEDD